MLGRDATEPRVAARGTLGHATVALAVVVQHMVESQVAGVLFTADPVTGHRGHTVIDASPGGATALAELQ